MGWLPSPVDYRPMPTVIHRPDGRRRMSDRQVDGALRLRGAGVGSIVAGICLALLAVASVPYPVAAGGVLALGILTYVFERRRASGFESRPSIGIAAVGAIGLFENTGFAFGLGPLALAGLAVAAGVIDIVAGSLFNRLRTATAPKNGENED